MNSSILFNPKMQWGLLGILCLFTFFINNGYVEPDIMEARNFVTAREMLENETWLIPTMNGEYRLAKPPLPTWVAAMTAHITGDIYNKTVMRIPAAIMASLMVFLLYAYTQLLTKDKFIPFLAGAVLATSFYVIFMGRQNTWDIYCHSLMLGAILTFSWGWNKQGNVYKEFIIGGILLGLSFMSKGPVAFYALLLPFLISYIYAFGIHPIKAKWKQLCWALLICIIISSWWPVYVFVSVPSDLMQTVDVETTAWSNRHVKPFWHYWSFPVQSGVWTVFITAALIIPYARKRIVSVGGNYKFLFCWVISTIVLLSLIPEKKERYLMPALVSMALLTAFYLRYLIEAFSQKKYTKEDVFIPVLVSILISILCLAAPYFLFKFGYVTALISMGAVILCSTFLLGSGIIFILFAIQKNTVKIIGASIVFTALVSAITPYILDRIVFHDHFRFRNLYHINNLSLIKDFPFYSISEMLPEEVWDVGKVVTPLQQKGICYELPQLPALILSPEYGDSTLHNLCAHQPILIDTLETFRHRVRKDKYYWHMYLVKYDTTALHNK